MKYSRTLGVMAALLCGGYLLVDRLGHRWGANDEEVFDTLPGDDAVPHPAIETTHAVTIRATPEAIWPWLMQMGYGRAGWYTDGWWYRMVDRYLWHVETPRADRIVPEWQDMRVGGVVPDGPPGTAYFTVLMLEPSHSLALYSTTHGTVWLPRVLRNNRRLGLHSEMIWAFTLQELEPGKTRLILRMRATAGPALYRTIARALLPPADFLVARMLLLRIRQRVERAATVPPAREIGPSGAIRRAAEEEERRELAGV